MARPNIPGRPLSMTEELEKLEQSITLTLQEIDSNFSKAHRIVTNTILPIVEQYGEHSKAVWEASMFWKQFFEASANVSLTGYNDDEPDATRQTLDEEESSAMRDIADHSVDHPHPDDDDDDDDTITRYQEPIRAFPEESMLDDPDGDLSGSTPRAPGTQTVKTHHSSTYQSPYSHSPAGRAEDEATQLLGDDEMPPSSSVRGGAAMVDEDDTSLVFNQRTARLNVSMTPQAPVPLSVLDKGKGKESGMRQHVLKKSFRLPTTPHRFVARMNSPVKARTAATTAATPGSSRVPASERKPWEDSPESSPEIAMPQIRSEAFMSPMRTTNIRAKLEAVPSARGPRTPGVSILPQKSTGGASRFRGTGYNAGDDPFTVEKSEKALPKDKYEIDWSSDSDDALGVSPPKTIQFAFAPQKLIQTPAREASRRIVDDIIATAGVGKEGGDESPTMGKIHQDMLDSTF